MGRNVKALVGSSFVVRGKDGVTNALEVRQGMPRHVGKALATLLFFEMQRALAAQFRLATTLRPTQQLSYAAPPQF
ncbi:hypothetical protein [Novosphingobium sp. Chol11]|uniref:hypothetical protein n=1 Tax=Novosphingobium sp. Chol11 TaxID=1385763 RepID=UPI0025FB23AB|nr:hypothetical protein [Novosphingobium sp. Chol11]